MRRRIFGQPARRCNFGSVRSLAPYPLSLAAVADSEPTLLRLAPDVPGLEALGAREIDDFLGEHPTFATIDRARPAGSALRFPLPGTPDEQGRQHEKPRGAGTGYLLLQRFPAGGV